MVVFFNFSPTLNHIHPLQVENCGSNSRLVVDEYDNVKSGLKGLNHGDYIFFSFWDLHKFHSQLVLLSFECQCYGSTAIIHILIISLRDRLYPFFYQFHIYFKTTFLYKIIYAINRDYNNGDISLQAWLNIANHKLSVRWTQCEMWACAYL